MKALVLILCGAVLGVWMVTRFERQQAVERDVEIWNHLLELRKTDTFLLQTDGDLLRGAARLGSGMETLTTNQLVLNRDLTRLAELFLDHVTNPAVRIEMVLPDFFSTTNWAVPWTNAVKTNLLMNPREKQA
jgi:hypothetical protein